MEQGVTMRLMVVACDQRCGRSVKLMPAAAMARILLGCHR
jgi:hypothetical protein